VHMSRSAAGIRGAVSGGGWTTIKDDFPYQQAIFSLEQSISVTQDIVLGGL
jgi:hypothetical protein